MLDPVANRLSRRTHRLAWCLLVVGAAAAVAAGLASASGSASPRLASARISGGRDSVELSARFSGANVPTGIVMTTDANLFDGSAAIVVPAAGISTAVAGVRGAGVRVHVAAGQGRLTFTVTAAPRAFTYVGYRTRGPGRLALVFWRSTPPPFGAHPHFGPAGCLTLRATVQGSSIRAAGGEARLFEHSFVLRLRARDGTRLAQYAITAAGHWTRALDFPARAGQAATLEAFAASAKDGSLACLAQQRIERS
jgi:hypothetical protein